MQQILYTAFICSCSNRHTCSSSSIVISIYNNRCSKMLRYCKKLVFSSKAGAPHIEQTFQLSHIAIVHKLSIFQLWIFHYVTLIPRKWQKIAIFIVNGYWPLKFSTIMPWFVEDLLDVRIPIFLKSCSCSLCI